VEQSDASTHARSQDRSPQKTFGDNPDSLVELNDEVSQYNKF